MNIFGIVKARLGVLIATSRRLPMYTKKELNSFLSQGQKQILSLMAKLDTYLADPVKKAKHGEYKAKRDQLTGLLNIRNQIAELGDG